MHLFILKLFHDFLLNLILVCLSVGLVMQRPESSYISPFVPFFLEFAHLLCRLFALS